MAREEYNSTLYVVGVPSNTTKEKIEEEFGKYGKVELVTILDTRGSYKTHTVFVKYSTYEDAKKAKMALNCTNPFDDGPTMTVKIADKDHKSKKRNEERRKEYSNRSREKDRYGRNERRKSRSRERRESRDYENEGRREYSGYNQFMQEKRNYESRNGYPGMNNNMVNGPNGGYQTPPQYQYNNYMYGYNDQNKPNNVPPYYQQQQPPQHQPSPQSYAYNPYNRNK